MEELPKYKQWMYKRIRILSWLPQYTKLQFLSDFIAGVTVGLTLLPQSIAYASIADLPPHVGLYTALMGSFVYILFGTIKQVSIGPSSILSLLTMTYVQGRGMDYIVLLTFISGCVELLMGILNLGIIVDFISSPVTSAFTSATALLIVVSQMKNIFGMHFKSSGFFDMIMKLGENLWQGNYNGYDAGLGISSMVFLCILKRISRLRFKSRQANKTVWFIGICRNAVTVLLGCIIAYIVELRVGSQLFHLAGNIVPGLPKFQAPPFSTTNGNATVPFMEMVQTLGTGVIVLPVVATLANVAIAKKFSDGRIFDAAQEMFALGISNIMGSFVGSMPTTGAFTRSAVNEASRVQTPMGGLYAGTIILLALSYLTPLFYYIPKPTIAAVLICAVIFMIEYEELPKLWQNNKFDFSIGIGTFVLSLYFGVETGLAIGCAVSLLKLFQYWARPKISAERRSCGNDNEYLFVKPELGLQYPAAGYFREELLRATKQNEEIPIVLECRAMISVDYTACHAIKDIVLMFKGKRKFVLLNVAPEVHRRLTSVINADDLDVRNAVDNGPVGILSEAKALNEVIVPLLQDNLIPSNTELLCNPSNDKKHDCVL